MNVKLKIHMNNRSLPFGVYQELLQVNMKMINIGHLGDSVS